MLSGRNHFFRKSEITLHTIFLKNYGISLKFIWSLKIHAQSTLQRCKRYWPASTSTPGSNSSFTQIPSNARSLKKAEAALLKSQGKRKEIFVSLASKLNIRIQCQSLAGRYTETFSEEQKEMVVRVSRSARCRLHYTK